MMAFSKAKFWQYSEEYFKQYCIYDEEGTLTGVKDDAPEDFKAAYEEEKKHDEKMAALGLD